MLKQRKHYHLSFSQFSFNQFPWPWIVKNKIFIILYHMYKKAKVGKSKRHKKGMIHTQFSPYYNGAMLIMYNMFNDFKIRHYRPTFERLLFVFKRKNNDTNIKWLWHKTLSFIVLSLVLINFHDHELLKTRFYHFVSHV